MRHGAAPCQIVLLPRARDERSAEFDLRVKPRPVMVQP
jgi:hypothetical protein